MNRPLSRRWYVLALLGTIVTCALSLVATPAFALCCPPFMAFPIPTAASGPRGITLGPDGAMWFTEFAANKIGRITQGGVSTEFPIPTANSGPTAIVAGPDGALWIIGFAPLGQNSVLRMTTDGVATLKHSSAFSSAPVAISVGPFDALWYTGDSHRMIRHTPPDDVEVFVTPTSAPPPSMAAGPHGVVPNGALWYTSGNNIFRFRYENAEHDFSRDGQSDILWRHSSDLISIWTMAESRPGEADVARMDFPGNAGPDWTFSGTGDVDADGDADIFWRHTDGTVAVWRMGGGSVPRIDSAGAIGTASLDWQIAGLADFNGDGRADILWRRASGEVAVWFLDGATLIGSPTFATVGPEWTIAGVGDFNGDFKPDILWRHTDGTVSIWLMDGTTLLESAVFTGVPLDWQIKAVGDFTGEETADILWQHTDGTVAIWVMDGTTVLTDDPVGFVPQGEAVRADDFNRDGRADILFRYANGDVVIWLNTGTGFVAINLGHVDASWEIQ